MLQAASRYRRFPFFCVDALLSAASFWAPSLLISNMFGAAVVGGVALALKLVNWPIILVGGAVGQVYTGEAARLMRENPAGQYPLLIKTTRRLAVLGSPLFVIGLAAPFVFAPVFGPKWQQAGLFCAILTPTAYLQLIIAPISALANIAERQHLQLLLDGSRAALIAVVFILAFRGHWAVIPTLIVYVSATTVSYVGYLLLYARVARAISLAHSSKPSAEERFP
jgi:O-antigen/teichoic acid export membrane protein